MLAILSRFAWNNKIYRMVNDHQSLKGSRSRYILRVLVCFLRFDRYVEIYCTVVLSAGKPVEVVKL